MDTILAQLSLSQLVLAFLIAVCGGFVKGVVGFAMPLVLISGLTTFIAPELALAGLIIPTLVTNAFQALRQGMPAAWESIRKFQVFLVVGGLALVASAQLVRVLPQQAMLLMIGIPVVFFAVLQLTGWKFQLPRRSTGIEAIAGAFAGGIGGISGIWGPPTVAYLTALGTQKQDQMRVQGVIYGLGSAALLFAHIGSGVLNPQTWQLSVVLVMPALLGMWLGGLVSDRIDQSAFRRATLVVLLIAGANLLRRAIMGF